MYKTLRKKRRPELPLHTRLETNPIKVIAQKHACFFCGKRSSKWDKHLLKVHKNERKVIDILLEQNLDVREAAFQELKHYGDYYHNMHTLTNKRGLLLVLWYEDSCPEDYLPCLECLGYVFYGDYLRHRVHCNAVRTRMRPHRKQSAKAERNAQAMKSKAVSAVVTGITGKNVVRNVFVIMLSDALMLTKDVQKMQSYKESVMKVVCNHKCVDASHKTVEISQLLQLLKQGTISGGPLPDHFDPDKVDTIFKLIKWLNDQSWPKDQSLGYLIQFLTLEITRSVKACAVQLKGKAIASGSNYLRSRVDVFISLFDSMARNNWVQICTSQREVLSRFRTGDTSAQSAATWKESMSIQYNRAQSCVLPREVLNNHLVDDISGHIGPWKQSMILEDLKLQCLVRDVQRLENYLSSEMQDSCAKLSVDPNQCEYFQLSVLTAAKIALFNKPRSGEAMRLTIISYNDNSIKLDPQDDTMECLSIVEKLFCLRLDVVKTPSKEGRMVPILLTPAIKKAMDLLVEKRSLVSIHPENPYIFADWESAMDSMNANMVFNTVALNVHLESAGLLQDPRLQQHVATISQIMAMQDNELDWLTSHIVNSLMGDVNVYSMLSFPFNLARVVQLLCGSHTEEVHHPTGSTLPQDQLSETPDYSHVRRALKKASKYHKKLMAQAESRREEERYKRKKEKEKRSQKNKNRKASKLKIKVLATKGGFSFSGALDVPVNPPSNEKSNQLGMILTNPASTSLPVHPGPSKRVFILPPKSDQPGLVIVTSPVSTTLPAHPGPTKGIDANPCLKRKSTSNDSLDLRKCIRTLEDSKVSFLPMQKAAEPVPRQSIVLPQQNDKSVQQPVTYVMVLPRVPPSEQPKVNSIHLGLPSVGGLWGVCEGNGKRATDGNLSNKNNTNGSTDGILSNKDNTSGSTDGILSNKDNTSGSTDGILSNKDNTSGSTDGILSNKDNTSGSTDGILSNKDNTSGSTDGILSNNSVASWSTDGILSNKDNTSGSTDGILSNKNNTSGSTDGILSNNDNTKGSTDGILSNKDNTSGSTDGILSNKDNTSGTTDGILSNNSVASWSTDGILRNKDNTSGSIDGFLSNEDNTNPAADGSVSDKRNTSMETERENLAQIGDLTVQIKTEPDDLEYREKEINSGRETEQETWTVMVEDAAPFDNMKPDPDVKNGEGVSGQGVDQSETTHERSTSPEKDQETMESIPATQNTDAYPSCEYRVAYSNDPGSWKVNLNFGKKNPRPASGHACMFCGVLLSEMVNHLSTIHANEKQVQEALSSQQALEQKVAMDELKRYGDHCHNIRALQNRKGTLIVLKEDQCNRKRRDIPCLEDYLPCPECLRYAFYGDFLSHRMHCDAFWKRMRSFCERSHVKERNAQAMKNKAVITFVNTGISGAKLMRNIFILMLSDALKLEKNFEKMTSYESMMKTVCVETASHVTWEAGEMWQLLEDVRQGDTSDSPLFLPEKVDALFRLIKWQHDQSRLKDHLHSNEKEIGYLEMVIRNTLTSCAIRLKQKASIVRDCDILSRVNQIITIFDSVSSNDRTQTAAIPKHILNLQRINNTSGEKRSQNHIMKADLSEIQNLISYVQKLEDYLDPEMQKNYEQLGKCSDRTGYLGLSLATAAKIVLLNKPRANEAMQLRVQSYNEESTNYDPQDNISKCLTTIEKVLCERLHVVKMCDKEGQMVPILLTPKIRKAVELLLTKRRVVNIHPNNPYIFAKWDRLMDGMKASTVLSTIAINVPLDIDCLQNARLQKHVATISQIMAMQDSELDWLKSHITNSLTGDIDFQNVQSSPLEMAKVVQLLCGNDSGDTQETTVHIKDESHCLHNAQQSTSNPGEQSTHTNRNCTVPSGSNFELVPDGSSGQVSFERNYPAPDFSSYKVPDVDNCLEPDGSNGQVFFVKNCPAPASSGCQKPDVNNCPEPVGKNHQVLDDNGSQVPDTNSCQVIDASSCEIPDGSYSQMSCDRNHSAPEFSNYQMSDANSFPEPVGRKYQVPDYNSSQLPDSRSAAQSHSPQYNVENQGHFTKESVPNLLKPDIDTDVHNKNDITSSAVGAKDLSEVKYSDFLEKANLSSFADNDQGQQEEVKSEINISVSIKDIMEDPIEEPIEEKYSDVLRRTGNKEVKIEKDVN
ncbi:hypothetical protein HOLleu_04505 [Holothuria leucospilota]|uniref:Uncharacterized protein n=1 Tax=Holothuria leucospilota TaxID=206669 RepID=A0A9Q1HKV1_HOLLE|nr:hypothetical protein HOLleu_04505 [Holothuria leucospilota]